MKEIRTLSIPLFRSRPVEKSRSSADDVALVGVLVHDVRGLDRGQHLAQLQQQIDPCSVLGLDGDLFGQIVFRVQVL